MEVWFDVNKKDVVEIIDKINNGAPWTDDPEERHSCLIFWEDGVIRLVVDEFFADDEGNYSCCRFYTNLVCDTLADYKNMSAEALSTKAYSAWCSGARCC